MWKPIRVWVDRHRSLSNKLTRSLHKEGDIPTRTLRLHLFINSVILTYSNQASFRAESKFWREKLVQRLAVVRELVVCVFAGGGGATCLCVRPLCRVLPGC